MVGIPTFVKRSFRLQLREQNHVADAFLAEEHHAQAVNAHAHAAGGRHAVFERDEKSLTSFTTIQFVIKTEREYYFSFTTFQNRAECSNMKSNISKLSIAIAIVFFAITTNGNAQTQTVTLSIGPTPLTSSASYNLASNQVVTIVAFDAYTNIYNANPYAILSFTNQTVHYYAANDSYFPLKVGSTYTGLTQISLYRSSSYSFYAVLTFTVTTPTPSVPYIPANAVVIPSDANGPVQIVLESSGDLVNWTSALPGTYGNTYSNRFFRVRAIAQ